MVLKEPKLMVKAALTGNPKMLPYWWGNGDYISMPYGGQIDTRHTDSNSPHGSIQTSALSIITYHSLIPLACFLHIKCIIAMREPVFMSWTDVVCLWNYILTSFCWPPDFAESDSDKSIFLLVLDNMMRMFCTAIRMIMLGPWKESYMKWKIERVLKSFRIWIGDWSSDLDPHSCFVFTCF